MINKFYFIILLIILKPSIAFSIGFIYPDSVKTDIQRIEWLISKGKKNLFANLDSAAIYANEAERINNKIEHEDLFGSLCKLQGSIELYRGNNKKAIQYYEKGYQFYLKKNDLTGICTAIYDMGIIYYNSAQFDKALEKDMEALEYAQKIPDSILISDCYSSISFIYSEKKNHTKALEYLSNSLEIDKKLNYTIGLAYSYSNIADIYEHIGILDSVAKNRYRSIELFKELQNDQGLAMSYNGLGSYYFTINELDSALHYYNISLKLRKKVGDKMGQALTLNAQAKVQLKYHHLVQAEKNAKRALQIASKIDGLNEAKTANKILSEIAYKRNNFKEAYQYYIEYTQLKDSMFSKYNMNKMAELEAKYETQKKNAEIKQLQIEQIKDENMQKLFLLIIVSLTAAAAFLIFFFRQRIKINTILRDKNTQLKQLNATQNRLTSIISHDFKAPLSAFYSITNSLKTKFDKIDRKEIDNFLNRMLNSSIALKLQLENMLNWAINQQRKISINKSTYNLSVLTYKVVVILQEFANEKSIIIENNIKDGCEIETDGRLLSIVLNNLITNAVKFSANNSKIYLSSKKEGNSIIISVKDTGLGMNKQVAKDLFTDHANSVKSENSGTGLGLIVSKDIITKLGGKIWAESEIGKGTVVFIEL